MLSTLRMANISSADAEQFSFSQVETAKKAKALESEEVERLFQISFIGKK